METKIRWAKRTKFNSLPNPVIYDSQTFFNALLCHFCGLNFNKGTLSWADNVQRNVVDEGSAVRGFPKFLAAGKQVACLHASLYFLCFLSQLLLFFYVVPPLRRCLLLVNQAKLSNGNLMRAHEFFHINHRRTCWCREKRTHEQLTHQTARYTVHRRSVFSGFPGIVATNTSAAGKSLCENTWEGDTQTENRFFEWGSTARYVIKQKAVSMW